MKNVPFRGLLATLGIVSPWRHVGRLRTMDSAFTAFPFRMPAGLPGTVNRSHPASLEPAQMDPDNPIRGFGLACVVSGDNPNMLRGMAAGDNALTKIYGIVARPYPFQQDSGGMRSSFAEGAPQLDQPITVCTSGYIMVPVLGDVVKGGPVFVWVAATTGDGKPGVDHIQGGFEAQATGGSTIQLADTIGNIEFNGPADENGFGEVRFRI